MFATDNVKLLATKPTCPCPAPGCGAVGSLVPATTLSSLLTVEAKHRLGSPEGFRFCPSKACEVVYWNSETGTRFTKGDLTTRVGLKETAAPRPVCYCFNFTVEDIERQVRATGNSTIPDEITAKIRAGLCRCETANPQGTCCLGNVRAAVVAAQGTSAEAIPVANRSKDLVALGWARGLWALAVVMGVAAASLELARPVLWSVGFGLAGTLCAVNAARSRRLHCIFTGPIFLLGAILSVLRWTEIVDFSWGLIGVGVLLGTAISCLGEFLSGKTYAGAGPASDDCCSPHKSLARTMSAVSQAPAVSAFGAMAAAILGSACCWLPLLLVASGASAGSASNLLGEHRVAFLAVSLLFLGTGFYTVYRKPGCRPDGTCSAPSPRLLRFNKVVLWMATGLVVAAALFPKFVGSFVPVRASDAAASDEEAVYAIRGMTCESCALPVRAELERLPGVAGVEVSFEEKTAKVHGQKGAHLPTDESAIDAIKRAGYDARRVSNH